MTAKSKCDKGGSHAFHTIRYCAICLEEAYDDGYEQGKSEAEEAYRTRYSVLNLCHKTIATDRVNQDNQIRKQTLTEVLKEMNLLNVGIDDSQHYIWEAWRDTKERLEQKIKELKEANK